MNLLEAVYKRRFEDEGMERAGRVWESLVRYYFQDLVGEGSRVLDIGCGFCHFLNHVKAMERVGVDANPSAAGYAAEGVEFYLADDLEFKMLPSAHFDRVFISNFLEHLNGPSDVLGLLAKTRDLLVDGGKVIILQPNFRLLGAAYFDFIDHKTILTDAGIEEALDISGFRVEKKVVRFLPYTTKSSIPVHPFIIRLYLALRPAWYLMGKQSLFVAVK